MSKLVVTSPSFCENEILATKARSLDDDIKLNSDGLRLEGRALANFVGNAQYAIVGLEKIRADVLDACPKLRAISKYGVGVDNIDFEACKARRVEVLVSPGSNKVSAAEHAIGLMFALSHNLIIRNNEIKSGIWIKDGGFQLSGKRIGLIGYGNVGKEVARLLCVFGCDLRYYDPVKSSPSVAAYCAFDELIEWAEVISLHASLNDTSRGIIGAREFNKMKSAKILINAARAELIDINALRSELIDPDSTLLVGLDVFHTEPVKEVDYLASDRVIVTPHIAGNTVEAVMNMGLSAISALEQFIRAAGGE